MLAKVGKQVVKVKNALIFDFSSSPNWFVALQKSP